MIILILCVELYFMWNGDSDDVMNNKLITVLIYIVFSAILFLLLGYCVSFIYIYIYIYIIVVNLKRYTSIDPSTKIYRFAC